MSTITWLHLSDFHFEAASEYSDQDIVIMRELLKDIEKCQREYALQLDFVAVTGDIARTGSPEEYRAASTFFDKLLGIAGLAKERLFLVPGNHDLDRFEISMGTDAITGRVVSREAMRNFLNQQKERERVFAKFSAYSDFVKTYSDGTVRFDADQTSYVQPMDLAGKRICVVGLNSAWLARGGEGDRAKLAVGEPVLLRVVDACAGSDACIVLMHHPAEWLTDWDSQSLNSHLCPRIDFILHGHQHVTVAQSLKTPDAEAMRLAAGACYDSRDYRNGYSFVRLNLHTGRGTIFWRVFDNDHWAKDVTTYVNAPDGIYEFDLKGKLAVAAAEPLAERVVVARPPAADDAEALKRYLEHVINANNCLQLQGIRSAGELVRIALEDIYVTLNATVKRTVAADEAMLRELGARAAGEAGRLARSEAGTRTAVEQVKVKVQEALAQHSRLVVLGDPGCGKTTLLRYLALTYARDLAGAVGLVERRLGLKERRLPILVLLREFALFLQAKSPNAGTDGPKLLLDYLDEYFAQQRVPLPAGFFEERLKAGEGVVLLDGMDEVADLALRNRIARLLEKCTTAYGTSRFVVTSRIVGYAGAARLNEAYSVTTVRDFNDEDIERFVTAWNHAIELALASGERGEKGTREYAESQAAQRTDKLLTAIRANEGVRELAINPLLLTVIALVQRYRARLPERRSELYEEAVEVLLANWDAAKGLSDRLTVAGRELDAGDQRSLLEPIALWMMEQKKREIETEELRRQLEERFGPMVGASAARKATDDFLAQLQLRSGLLVERGQGVYAFSHLTFQEYLAARAVADRPDYIAYTVARLSDGWWREAILLEAGYLSAGGTGRVTALIRAIMDCPGEQTLYHNLTLAAQALGDVGPARVGGDLGGEVDRRLRRAFEEPIQPGKDRPKQAVQETIRRRAAAAEALARIQQGRGSGPAFWRLPYGEPDWVEIPAGEFWMGSESRASYSDERPVHRVDLERFWIARTPVTNAQYRIFVEKTGRKPPQHWDGDKPPRGQESHPVVNVTWHDALAYCRWLSEAIGKAITLPSEAQWEKAARGDRDRREYPWGDAWDATKCNCEELKLGGTTPVGVFPEGASPYGCLDMVGNAWEWTRSLWGKDGSEPTYRYPYVAGDGREDTSAGDEVLRVLRGGAYDSVARIVRCAYRYRLDPSYWNVDIGLRLVAAPM